MKSKILKQIISFLTFPALMSMGMPVIAQKYRKDKKDLKFNNDGKFKILHLTDIHEVDPEMDDEEDREIPKTKSMETMNVIEKCLDMTNPDLVVFGGDSISGYWEEFTYNYISSTIKKIIKPIKDRNIPLAIVFGNHDSEIEKNYREFQMLLYLDYENFIGTFNDEEMFGCGNCNIPIKSSDGKRNAFNIWLMDSNSYRTYRGEKGYDCVHEDQLKWYEKKEEELKKENSGKSVPAILFQHIPVVQEYMGLDETDEETELSKHEKYFKANEKCVSGRVREAPCPPDGNDYEQFELWKKHGDVLAAFFGHDHMNDFCMEIDGIKLYQTLCAGYHTYGKERGGRVIILDENNPTDIYTKTIEIPRITDLKLK